MDTNNLRVLVADDEPGMRLGVTRSLKNFKVSFEDFETEVGFEIDQADCGKTTLGLLESNSYDLLLLDYKMPDITGLDVLNFINEKEMDVLTIMVSAYSSLEVAISTTKNGAFDFLTKPFSPEELRNVVKKAVHNLFLTRQARKLAEEKKQVRFQFLSVLSHELKAPLNAIDGYLRIMDEKIAGNELSAYDKMIHRSLARIDGMRKLIYDLLDLTRIESGTKTRKLTPVDIIAVAERSIETVLPDAQARNITINLNATKKVAINSDDSELEIIFNNLLSNAVKYNRDNGTIDVDIWEEDNNIFVIKVSDTGIGMSEREMEKLFGEFVRFKNQKTKHIEGSGLGLSILKKLSSLYGGDVTAESEPDVGTSFTVTLKSDSSKEAADSI